MRTHSQNVQEHFFFVVPFFSKNLCRIIFLEESDEREIWKQEDKRDRFNPFEPKSFLVVVEENNFLVILGSALIRYLVMWPSWFFFCAFV